MGCAQTNGSSDVDGDFELTEEDSAEIDQDGDVEEEESVPVFDADLASNLQNLLEEHLAFSNDPGVTMSVIMPDGTSFSAAAGASNIAAEKEMLPDSLFRVGSNTKPIVAVVVLQLVQEGKIGLDDSLTDYLPQYEQWSNITIRYLLNMRSGMKEFLAITSLMMDALQNAEDPVNPEDVLDAVYQEPLTFEPGSDGAYTNSSYLALGLIIEKVTGRPAEQEIADRIITPLQLSHTYLDLGDSENSDLAEGYIDMTMAGPVLKLPASITLLLPSEIIVDGLILGSHLLHPTLTWTAGALVSSSGDMATFMHALFSGKLLSEDMIEQMKETQEALLFNGPVLYGLGLQVRPTPQGLSLGHGGLNFGYQAATYYLPEHDLVVSHMHNFLVELYDPFQAEMVDTILEGGVSDYSPCLLPDDLYRTFDTGKYLNITFKAEVTSPGADPKYGTSRLRLEEEDGSLPFGGLFPTALLEEKDGKETLTLTSYGLSENLDADIRVVLGYASESLFGDLDSNGRKIITQANLDDLIVLVADAELDEDLQVIRMCFTAVSDPTRTGEAATCNAEFPTEGDVLKLFASLPIVDDPEAVQPILETIMVPACICPNGTNSYQACE